MVRWSLVLVGLLLCCGSALAGGAADHDAGIARLNAGDASAAIELFTRAIQSRELDGAALALTYHHRGMAFHREGQAGRAILDYTTAFWNEELPKEFRPRTLNNRGLSFELINDFDSAIRDYNLAIRLNPNYAEAFGNRGNAHRRAGRHDEAIADYDSALRNNHAHPKFVFAWQGMSLEAQGKRSAAMEAFRRALAIDPNFELAKTKLAKLEETQALDTVLGRRKPPRASGGPLVLTATPGSQASTAQTTALTTAGDLGAPWTPPAPVKPSIVKAPPPEPEPEFSLRPAFDDQQPRAGPSAEIPRVARTATVALQPPPPAPSPTAPPAQRAATGEGGSDLEFAIQLGSFKSQELAEKGWVSLLGLASDLLEGLSHVVEPATLPDKRTVYRLFGEALPDREAALSLCRTLRDKGAPCIVVRR